MSNNTKLPSLGVNFWQFQKDYLADNSRFIAICYARGNGKSMMTALKIVLDVFENEAQGKRSDWLIVSASAPQAQACLRLVEAWSRVFLGTAVALNIIEEEVEFRTEDNLERYTRYRLRLGRSTQVIALSASPNAVRGYTSNVFADEIAFLERGQEFFNAMQHCTRGYLRLIVASTPCGGSENIFHRIMHSTAIVRGKPLWSHHWADIHRAIADGRVYDLESERLAADPYSFRSEMLLEWSDSPNTWFSSELIASCEDPRASAVGHGYNRGRCFIGNDVGLRHDKWCAFVLEATEDFGVHTEDCPNGQKISYYTGELITREVVVLDRSSFAEHDRQIARLFAKYNVIRMAIDRTGMGERSTEEYQNLYGSKVEGVNFTTDTKGNMATLGLELMTERRVLLPQDHPEIGADFRKLQRVVSAGGNVRFQAARDNSGHGDVVWSFLLACNAAWTPQTPVEVKTSGESAQEQNIMAGWTTGLEGMRSGK